MPIDAKHEDLQSLRIDRTARAGGEGEPPVWARRYILIGIGALVLLGVVAIGYRVLSHDAPEVEVVRASAQSSDVGGVVLSASGYIVAHHKINLNSKVTGRVAWIGVEKGDHVKEGQVSYAWKMMNFVPSMNRRKERPRTHVLISRNCRTDLAPRRFNRHSIIWTKLEPLWPMIN